MSEDGTACVLGIKEEFCIHHGDDNLEIMTKECFLDQLIDIHDTVH